MIVSSIDYLRKQGFVFLSLLFLVATIPLGSWQEVLFAGLTIPKILIPAMTLLFLAGFYRSLSLYPHSQILLLFIVCTFPSLVESEYSFLPILFNFFGYLLLCNILFNVVTKHHHLMSMMMVYLVGLGAISALVLCSVFLGIDVGVYFGREMVESVFGLKRLLGTEENPNAFAVYYIPAIPITMHFFFERKRRLEKLIMLGCMAVFIACLILTSSRGAFVAALVAGSVLMYFRFRGGQRYILFGTLIALGLIGSILLPYFLIEHVNFARTFDGDPMSLIRDKEAALQHRINMLEPVLAVFMDYPFFGVGYGNFSNVVESNNLYQKLSAHNIFFGIAVELGVFALASFCLLLFRSIRQLLMVVNNPISIKSKNIFSVVLASMAGFLVNGLVHESYVSILFWLFIGLSACCVRIHLLNVTSMVNMRRELQAVSEYQDVA